MWDLGIDLDVWPWIWLAVAVVFALVELTILGGSIILLPFAISAFVASLLAFAEVPVAAQWLVFLLGGMALFVVLARWARQVLRDELPPGVGADRLVGLTGIVLVDISPDDTVRRGRVAVDGETWGALAAGERSIHAGQRVRVTSMQGTRLVVEPVPPTQPSEEVP